MQDFHFFVPSFPRNSRSTTQVGACLTRQPQRLSNNRIQCSHLPNKNTRNNAQVSHYPTLMPHFPGYLKLHTEENGGQGKIKDEESNGTDEEQHKLSLMRAAVECCDPASKEVDDLTLRRFLRARALDVENAATFFLKYLKWRRTFVPNGHISDGEVQNEIAQNKMFLGGADKKGCPILLVFGGRHFRNTNPDEFKRVVVFCLDKICSRIPPGQEKFVGIGDLQGWGYSNSDIRGYLAGLSILQDCYPERLGKLFIVHAPRIFQAVWKIVYPFIDNKTKTKIVFVDDRKLKSTLLEDIEESQLPHIYGGKHPLVPIQEA